MELTHDNLTEIAVKWLQRPDSKNGPGCHLAVSECRSGWSGEIPDAIGWRTAGYLDGSVVVEVKVSRSDFLADKNKPHRSGESLGLGNWRYYMCPEGLVQPDDLPPLWGLLWVNSRGHVKVKVGPMLIEHYGQRTQAITDMRQDSDYDGERFILVKLFGRVGDVDEMNRKVKETLREKSRLFEERNKLTDELKKVRRESTMRRRMLELIRKESPELLEKYAQEFDTLARHCGNEVL